MLNSLAADKDMEIASLRNDMGYLRTMLLHSQDETNVESEALRHSLINVQEVTSKAIKEEHSRDLSWRTEFASAQEVLQRQFHGAIESANQGFEKERQRLADQRNMLQKEYNYPSKAP